MHSKAAVNNMNMTENKKRHLQARSVHPRNHIGALARRPRPASLESIVEDNYDNNPSSSSFPEKDTLMSIPENQVEGGSYFQTALSGAGAGDGARPRTTTTRDTDSNDDDNNDGSAMVASSDELVLQNNLDHTGSTSSTTTAEESLTGGHDDDSHQLVKVSPSSVSGFFGRYPKSNKRNRPVQSHASSNQQQKQQQTPSMMIGHQTLRLSSVVSTLGYDFSVATEEDEDDTTTALSVVSSASLHGYKNNHQHRVNNNRTIHNTMRPSSTPTLKRQRHRLDVEHGFSRGAAPKQRSGPSTTTNNNHHGTSPGRLIASQPQQFSKMKRHSMTNNRPTGSPQNNVQEDFLFFEQQQDALRLSMTTRNNNRHRGGGGGGLSMRTTTNSLDINNEVGLLGGTWRALVRNLVLLTYDDVNGRRLGRILQQSLPFMTAYESYLASQVIEALDHGNKTDPADVLAVAFQNRNVSRIIVQNLRTRHDFLWHWGAAVSWNRLLDAVGLFPLVGAITRFPATENVSSTRDHALASMLRVLLGEGNWLTRVVTQGREGLITDNPNAIAQNLAAESNNFENANRNQYGTNFGRVKTNQFRLVHRLPTDESIIRTFVTSPMPTTTNNGVVHMLRQLANHWKNMLEQEWGNFAHQRMEQLNPFETLRFHMPEMLVLLSSLRGRNCWDQGALGHFICKLQNLKPGVDASDAKALINELQDDIVVPVSGGIASVVDPFRRWLEAIAQACVLIEQAAQQVYEIATSVEIGIRLGYDILTQISWKVPCDDVLKKEILQYIRGEDTTVSSSSPPTDDVVNKQRIDKALQLTTPRDKRTLIELVKQDLAHTKPAQLLLNRVKTLLQREIRREVLNETIRTRSMGEYVYDDELVENAWYWLEENIQEGDDNKGVYIYRGRVAGRRNKGRFIHVDSNVEKMISMDNVKTRKYTPVAEAITRAQKAFMNIELDHGKKFSFNAFMEFSYLRIALRRLIVVSQMACEELDNARLNVLREVQRSNKTQVAPEDLVPGTTYYMQDPQTKQYRPFVCKKRYTPADLGWATLASIKIVSVQPQNVIVVGGGPAGLLTTIHCTESVLGSGGAMTLYEARDAFNTGGSTFERAQIVRLDARWISMMRYHLGTAFEDGFIALAGETDSQLGNTLPSQGFVEITIKDLENMLHVVVSRFWSRGVVTVYSDSKAQYDPASNSLTKFGENLKVDDRILRRVDKEGKPCKKEYHSWKVVELTYTKPLGIDDLQVGKAYGAFVRTQQSIMPFKLVAVDLESKIYTFRSLSDGNDNMKAHARSLPSLYPSGTDAKAHANIHSIVLESVMKGSHGGYVRDELSMDVVKNAKFTLDIGNTHVVEAIGKPHDSQVLFQATGTEPCGTCCLQGLKVSMGMHNFGETRWGSGILDDIRSVNDQNTRIVGDFTKMVRAPRIFEEMYNLIISSEDWQSHFEELIAQSAFPELNEFDPIVPKLIRSCEWLVENSPSFRRPTLQTRFFETGDVFYLGMEFNREYDTCKKDVTDYIVGPLRMKKMSENKKEQLQRLKIALMHHLDRLFFSACLSTLKRGDVYNPGARHRVPDFFLINSYSDVELGSLPVGESFRLSDDPKELYEVLVKVPLRAVVVRSVEGNIIRMNSQTKVKRQSNLTRGPDGNQESKVALSSFPVGHYINYRTMRLSNKEQGYVFAFAGDSQSTPHFMRYSGLTGAAINAMSFNIFVKQAIEGASFIERFREYSSETNWSNGEVVQRGTSANYGHGLLRPGFSYRQLIEYLYSKVIEYQESDQDPRNLLSRDWKVKFAASLVPRGMELNDSFQSALKMELLQTIFDKFVAEVIADDRIQVAGIEEVLRKHLLTVGLSKFSWDKFLATLDVGESTRILLEPHVTIANCLAKCLSQITEFATESHLYNMRISSELFNQPSSVDSIVDDFAVEAQSFANSLTIAAAFAAGALALQVIHTPTADAFSTLLGVINIATSFDTMASVGRYKVRNEESRTVFADEKFARVQKAVFLLMDRNSQDAVPVAENPFVRSLEARVAKFRAEAKYYGYEEPAEFKSAYLTLKSNITNKAHIKRFQKKLATQFIATDYQENSYVQEALVEVYKTVDDMASMVNSVTMTKTMDDNAAKAMFDRLTEFEPTLEASIQRGPVRWGFVKQRKLAHWDIVVACRYFLSLIWWSNSKQSSSCCAPIETQTLDILQQLGALSMQHQSQFLRRELRDVEALYWATRESDIASLIFLAGFLGFVASIIFTVARIFSISQLETFAYWAIAATALGAILALFHFVRKLVILFNLWVILGSKHQQAAMDDKEDVRKVRSVTGTQIVLTVLRLVAALTASIALPWSVAEQGFGSDISTPTDLPFWIALVSVSTAVAATFFFFVVEFYIRYNLSPMLGPFVCESFREEIKNMYTVLAVPQNNIVPTQVQEREAWEYTAREFLHEYRFDTVFAADRFGGILQYLQSGMEPRNEFV